MTRYREAVYGICYHRVGHPEEAKDLAQEAFVPAYLDLGQLRDPEAFPAWLRRVTEHVCGTWQRRRRLEVISLERAPEPTVDRDLDLPLAVRHALRQLTPAARLAVTLYYVNGYSVGEVARFLEVPARTGEIPPYHHARRRLQGALMDDYAEGLEEGAPGDEFTERGGAGGALAGGGEAVPFGSSVAPESDREFKRYLVLEKDGTVLGVSFYGTSETYLRGVRVPVASCDVTSGENEWHKGGLEVYDRLKAAAGLANLAELGYPLAMTHEEVIEQAPPARILPCFFYHFPGDRAGGEPPTAMNPPAPSGPPPSPTRNGAASSARCPARLGAGSWNPGELSPLVLEHNGAVVGCCTVMVKHRCVSPWTVNEMEGVDMAAYRDLARHVAEMALAKGDTTISTYFSPAHPLGALMLARGGVYEMKGVSWNVAKHEEFVRIRPRRRAARGRPRTWMGRQRPRQHRHGRRRGHHRGGRSAHDHRGGEGPRFAHRPHSHDATADRLPLRVRDRLSSGRGDPGGGHGHARRAVPEGVALQPARSVHVVRRDAAGG